VRKTFLRPVIVALVLVVLVPRAALPQTPYPRAWAEIDRDQNAHVPPGTIAASSHDALLQSLVLGSAAVLVAGLADNSIRDVARRSGAETKEMGIAVSEWSPRVALGIGVVTLGVGLGTRSPALARTGRDALVAMGAAGVVTALAKIVVGRERPSGADDADLFEPFSFGSADNSFPSGHTSQAFALAAVIAGHTHNRMLRITAYGSAAAVGVARIAADRHFASDVVAGAIVGTIAGHVVVRRFGVRDSHVSLTPFIAPGQFGLAVQRSVLIEFSR
jgi:membrane-associated phospholipid phosphatase